MFLRVIFFINPFFGSSQKRCKHHDNGFLHLNFDRNLFGKSFTIALKRISCFLDPDPLVQGMRAVVRCHDIWDQFVFQ